MTATEQSTYNAQLTAGALLLAESREVARLLMAGVDEQGWHKAIELDNVLQKRSAKSAKRIARMIRARLELLKPEMWRLVAEGDRELASQVLLVATIKHSPILGDFMRQVLRDAVRTFRKELSRDDWVTFLTAAEHEYSEVGIWSEQTRRKLGSAVLRALVEGGYLESTRSLALVPFAMCPEVRQYLNENDEQYALACMDIRL